MLAVTAVLMILYVAGFVSAVGKPHWVEIQVPGAYPSAFDLLLNGTEGSGLNISLGLDQFCIVPLQGPLNCTLYETVIGRVGWGCAEAYIAASLTANSLLIGCHISVYIMILVFAGFVLPLVKESAKPPTVWAWRRLIVLLIPVGICGPLLELTALCFMLASWHTDVCGLSVRSTISHYGKSFWTIFACFILTVVVFVLLMVGVTRALQAQREPPRVPTRDHAPLVRI